MTDLLAAQVCKIVTSGHLESMIVPIAHELLHRGSPFKLWRPLFLIGRGSLLQLSGLIQLGGACILQINSSPSAEFPVGFDFRQQARAGRELLVMHALRHELVNAQKACWCLDIVQGNSAVWTNTSLGVWQAPYVLTLRALLLESLDIPCEPLTCVLEHDGCKPPNGTQSAALGCIEACDGTCGKMPQRLAAAYAGSATAQRRRALLGVMTVFASVSRWMCYCTGSFL
mmetsp:Transcript_136521/g.248858  ORF Transcript_136521/g.248858 Transcript_136521/m.248858 type:complete len:228 (+) Transcript_136521:1792-2475(+)